MSLHILPAEGLAEHETTDKCVCGPRPEVARLEDGSVRWTVVHNAMGDKEGEEESVCNEVA